LPSGADLDVRGFWVAMMIPFVGAAFRALSAICLRWGGSVQRRSLHEHRCGTDASPRRVRSHHRGAADFPLCLSRPWIWRCFGIDVSAEASTARPAESEPSRSARRSRLLTSPARIFSASVEIELRVPQRRDTLAHGRPTPIWTRGDFETRRRLGPGGAGRGGG